MNRAQSLPRGKPTLPLPRQLPKILLSKDANHQVHNFRNHMNELSSIVGLIGPPPKTMAIKRLPDIVQRHRSPVNDENAIGDPKVISLLAKWEKPSKLKHKCYIGTGNVDAVIKVLKSRESWMFVENMSDPKLQFIWKQTNSGINFNLYSNQTAESSKTVNHFEFHTEVSQKDQLLRNFTKYCEANKLDVFEYLPPSFELKVDHKNINNTKEGVRILFEIVSRSQPNTEVFLEAELKRQSEAGIIKLAEARQKLGLLFEGTNELKRIGSCMNKGTNMWIMKPNDCNRGIGIELISSSADFLKVLGAIEAKVKQSRVFGAPPRKILMQKYIESPLLVHGRKFDIRMWVLLDSFQNVYIFPEGYLRLSSEKYSLEDQNKYIHLTNNAIQLNSANYGKFERGNQMSFEDLRSYLRQEKNQKVKFDEIVYPRMMQLIKMAFASAANSINANRREKCFELFGIDFMIDLQGVVWLIEINTNPCLALSSPLLESLIPRMLDDCFKIVLDPIFPPATTRPFHIPSYPDDRILWRRL